MAAFDTVVEATGVATDIAPAYDTVVEATGFAVAPDVYSVSLGADVGGIEPYTTVALHATLVGGSGAVLALSQTAGPVAGISGSAPDWTYVAPAVLDQTGAHLIFNVTATLGDQVEEADCTHFVYPNTFGCYDTAGQLVAVQVTDSAQTLATPFPDAGLHPDSGVRLRS